MAVALTILSYLGFALFGIVLLVVAVGITVLAKKGLAKAPAKA